MIRLLIISTVSGLLLAACCIGGAVALGGRAILSGAWKPPSNFVWNVNPDVDINWETQVGPIERREFAWDGDNRLEVGFPADVVYVQGPVANIFVSGPKSTVDRFYVEGGELRLRGWDPSNTFTGAPSESQTDPRNRPPRLKIEVTAPSVTSFELSGSETVTIDGYDQDSLDIELSGASKATAKGKVRHLTARISGAAEGELSGLQVAEADVEVSGVSRASVGPSDSAELEVSGASHVTLTKRPGRLSENVSGISHVEESFGPVADASPTPPEKPVPPAKPATKSKR